jgi:hypothetical protein
VRLAHSSKPDQAADLMHGDDHAAL